jgi:endonuclease-3
LNHNNKFELLIAVLLSAQCTDERVNQVTPILFKLANTAQALSKISVGKIYKIIKPCGLGPQKSRAISKLSKILVKDYNGKVPESFEDLEKLPGVGHKTASVVMSQGFGHPAFPVDTHIHRLSQRWGLTNGKNVVQTEEDLKKLFPKKSWNKLHLQIIYYGREYCTAKSCYGLECEICNVCFPNRRKKIYTKK